MAEADEKISVVIKPTSAHGSVKYTLDTTPNAQVSTLKEMLAEHSSIPVAEQRLIYKGQILKDDHTLASYGIANEHVVHLVRSRAAQTPSSAPASTAATITTAPNPAAAPAAQAAPSLGMMGGLSASPAELMGNPEMMAQMMNNPMVQSMLNNPELMRSMMSSNPAVQQLIERNPELGAMLNDPAVLRQSLQIASNPALMREHMRHADRAISNLESMPEGFNALRRMFETVQEPLMAAASEMDPMATLMGGTAGAARSTPANTAPGTGAGTQGAAVGAGDATPNAAPLPNPWAPAAPAGGAMAGTGAGAGMPPLGLGLGSAGLGGAAGRGSAGLPHIDMVSQMMQRPGMREMMSSMMSNPAFMDQILTMNPMLRQMVESTPGMRDMLTNPAMVDAMLNPATLQSLSSMQANNPQLQQIMQAMGGGAPGLGGLGGPGGNPDQVAGMLGMMEMLGGAGPGMGGAGGFGGAGFGISAPAADPQTQYAAQLTALADMGFTDTAANVRALQATGGNVHAAVDRLLSGM